MPMLSSIYSGIYKSIPGIPVYCPTGNCSWTDASPSLAICGQCTNVTDSVTRNCGKLPEEYLTFDGDLDPKEGWCNLTTPSGLELSTFYFWDLGNGNTYGGTIINNSMASFTDDSNDDMTDVDVSSSDISIPTDGDIYGDNRPSHTIPECSLRWCLASDIEVKVFNGSLSRQAELVDVFDTAYTRHYSDYNRNHLENLEQIVPLSTVTYQFNEDQSTLNIPRELNITVNLADTSAIRQQLASILKTKWSTHNVNAYDSNLLAETLLGCQNLSLVMWNHIRTTRNATDIYGEAWTNVTFVKVRWGWLSLLVITTALSIIFLTMVIILNHLNAISLWKSNNLALLFHGLDGWSSSELDVREVATMTKMAGTMKGKLEQNMDGYLKIVRSEAYRRFFFNCDTNDIGLGLWCLEGGKWCLEMGVRVIVLGSSESVFGDV
jgi:hypothetical protein